MNRNTNSHFAVNPAVNIGRSKLWRNASRKSTCNCGQIVPFYLDEVLPGDSMRVKTNKVIRMQTLVTPVMDNIYCDTFWFFVPNRLVWSHWKEFMGENTASAWAPSVQYTIPQITSPSTTGWAVGGIADHLGQPVGIPGLSTSALPFRGYALICNEFFRSEALSQPLNIPMGDSTVAGVNTGTFVTDVAKGGECYTAAKLFDFYTGALPQPQRGNPVTIPLTNSGNFPVVTMSDSVYDSPDLPLPQLRFANMNTGLTSFGNYNINLPIEAKGDTGNVYADGTSALSTGTIYGVVPDNLWAVNSGQLVGASINALRTAFQVQKMLEADARGGGRYISIIKNHFGVTSPDARLQRPEFLGGNRIPVTINQVIQQSETGSTPQGTTAAYSLTTDSHVDFDHSFTEHGYLFGLLVFRAEHSYQQGLERHWLRKDRYDYYWPALSHLGEQEIKLAELYATGTPADDTIFGYQERYGEYRYKPNSVTGEMRSAASNSLDSWHLADDYSSQPYLSDSWIREGVDNVDRCLAVQSSVANQFFFDVYVQNLSTRPMPLYGVPGLIDHF